MYGIKYNIISFKFYIKIMWILVVLYPNFKISFWNKAFIYTLPTRPKIL